MSETFLDGRVTLWGGDNRDVLRGFEDNSFDSIVTDPPYVLVSIVKRFGKTSEGDATKTSERARGRVDGYARLTAGGFMGQKWDTGETVHAVEFWQECLRVLKPGGHVVAFAGTRTYHRMACAVEDAGFEIRDMLSWLYGSGFPKSHDVSKGLGKMLAGPSLRAEWEGWGTALKPALEPVCFGRKPLVGTVAQNVLEHGTGAINVDGCRVATDELAAIGEASWGGPMKRLSAAPGQDGRLVPRSAPHNQGRWPANVIHDGSGEVIAAFPDSSGGHWSGETPSLTGKQRAGAESFDLESGSAARFFYTAKADADDRIGSKHPTVKPIDLMQWLCRLVTPKGGTVLDPFAGTGTTGEAAFREGFNAVLIEREAEYLADIRRRMALVMAGPDERRRELIKAKLADQELEVLPLFDTSR